MRWSALLALILLVLPGLGARRIQGPVWGVVETADGAVFDDLVGGEYALEDADLAFAAAAAGEAPRVAVRPGATT